MTDRVVVRDLRLPTHVGVSAEERSAEQDVLVTVEMIADLSGPGSSDDLADTVDYHAAVTEISELVRASTCKLLERLAEGIASRLLERLSVSAVTVEVRKAASPVEEEVGAIAVRIERP